MTFRGFVFTHNNPKEGDYEAVKDYKGTRYGIIGNEVGESGTPHIQGYLYFKKNQPVARVIKKLAKTFGKKCYVSAAKGGPKANKDYCSKDGDYYEWGEAPAQGKRRDLEKAAEMLREGESMKAVADEMPGTYIRYYRGLAAYQGLHLKEESKDFRHVEVVLITGPTGCGKTRMAMEQATYKITGGSMKWFDGYEGEKTILIDEYANQLNCTELLPLLDGYQLRIPVKGGFTYACWTKVFITTNLRELHESALPAHREALARRISRTVNMWPEDDARDRPSKRRFEELVEDEIESFSNGALFPTKKGRYL